jgi:hypothetical protein
MKFIQVPDPVSMETHELGGTLVPLDYSTVFFLGKAKVGCRREVALREADWGERTSE